MQKCFDENVLGGKNVLGDKNVLAILQKCFDKHVLGDKNVLGCKNVCSRGQEWGREAGQRGVASGAQLCWLQNIHVRSTMC